MGQVYVLVSRVTDPKNFHLCGIPPKDMEEEVAQARFNALSNLGIVLAQRKQPALILELVELRSRKSGVASLRPRL